MLATADRLRVCVSNKEREREKKTLTLLERSQEKEAQVFVVPRATQIWRVLNLAADAVASSSEG